MMCRVDVSQAVLAILAFLAAYVALGGHVVLNVAALAATAATLLVALIYGVGCLMGGSG